MVSLKAHILRISYAMNNYRMSKMRRRYYAHMPPLFLTKLWRRAGFLTLWVKYYRPN